MGHDGPRVYNPAGANLRDVWTIATQPYKGAHFATFPEALVEPCIKAGTSAHGACSECGAPWRREAEKTFHQSGPARHNMAPENNWGGSPRGANSAATTGWAPTCEHDAPTVPCVVLDPFAGSGTVCAVAQRLGRHGVGVELNPEYLALSVKRLTAVNAPLPGLS